MPGGTVVRLASLDAVDPRRIGAKASGIVRSSRLGLRVAPGFVVDVGAYREHLAGLEIGPKLTELTRSPGSTSPTLVAARLASLRTAIVSTPMHRSVATDVAAAYAALGRPAVAVRSSATVEDRPDHSFAGQYDTFLGVTGVDDLLDRIQACWASLWSDRAVAYRARAGFDRDDGAMAVLVQAMVDPCASGVAFSADPVSGDRERILLEATPGLGDRLVDGTITPERYVLSASGRQVVERPLGPDTIGACLNDAQARELASIVLRLAEAERHPIDVEWSRDDRGFVVHQVRPITTWIASTPADGRNADAEQVWFDANAGEVLPDVVTPMTWSVVELLLNRRFVEHLDTYGIDVAGRPLVGRIAGRVYFNLSTLLGLLHIVPGTGVVNLTTEFGGDQERAARAGELQVERFAATDVTFDRWRFVGRLPHLLGMAFGRSPRRGLRFAQRLNDRVAVLNRRDLEAMREPELLRALVERFRELDRVFVGLTHVAAGVLRITLLTELARRWLDDDDAAITHRLLGGLGAMDSADAGLALWRLSRIAAADPDVAATVASGDRWATVRTQLDATPGGQAFLEAWTSFMNAHGHHARGEIELANPRWSETPDYVLERLRSFLAHGDGFDPDASHARRGREREALQRACRASMWSPLRRYVFRHLLASAQLGSLARENVKSASVRYLVTLRRSALELGRRWAMDGRLDDVNDVFFVELDELRAIARRGWDPALTDRVRERRERFEADADVDPPGIVIGDVALGSRAAGPTRWHVSEPSEGDLVGIAVSPGVVRGRARVVLRSDDDVDVLPGEILVAPYTDPGWTPYFLPAAGIVVDLGGVLSHGSIVAREYGIPAVVNVGSATRSIATGAWIEVDGTRGIVRRLKS